MNDSVARIDNRVEFELKRADEILKLARELAGRKVVGGSKQELLRLYEPWYRSVRKMMELHDFSGLEEFEEGRRSPSFLDFLVDPSGGWVFGTVFEEPFEKQVALLCSFPEELKAGELSLYKQLSIGLVESEIEQAEELLGNGFDRAACVVAGVSLERFVKTLYSTKVDREKVPKSFEECLVALMKGMIIEERQRKHLSALYNVRSDCAHPGRDVRREEIRKFVDDIRSVVVHLRF